ncbi:MAG TPA: phosphorylase [Candidimonas sp.]|nr:phosphorylase [Candidimonas sp.]
MTTDLMQAVDSRIADARATGALLPIVAEEIHLYDQGLPFIVRWLSTLAEKNGSGATMPGGPRDPDFNPFLTPDPELTIGDIGDDHRAILNKFPVADRHLVLARKTFEEQTAPLTLADFNALSQVMSASGGVGFFNGGRDAGASQRHKHLQWVPAAQGNPSLRYLAEGLPYRLPEHALERHPQLAFNHLFVRVLSGVGTNAAASAASMLGAYELACPELGLLPDDNGLLPSYNILVDSGWMLVVPRRCEHVGDVSVNALSYGGTIYVRHFDQVASVRQAGPLSVLVQAAHSTREHA